MISYLIFIVGVGVVVLTWLIVGNIFSPKNNAVTTTPTTHVNSRKAVADLDSDSEEDEGLFGKQQKSSGLFDGLRQPSNSQGSSKSSSSIIPSAPPKSLGVENVRAMPDATPVTASFPVKAKKKESNLFASDSDDEEDLFSSKPAPSGKTSNTSHSQGEAKVPSSGGLFSSDDDSPLFSGPSPAQESKSSKQDDEEPPPQPKESTRKVPVGGVSIFGSAITSALRRQQSSDEESSDDEVPNANTTKAPLPASSKPDDKAPQKPASVKMPVKGGLFDSDEDENLFDTLVRKPAVVSNEVKNTHSGTTASSRPENKTKDEERNKQMNNESASNLAEKDTAKSTAGLFSDEEDDIFAISTPVKNKNVSLPPSLPEKSAKMTPETSKMEEEAVRATSRPPSLFTPSDYQASTEPVTIAVPPKSNHSLFSSPSDDDDDIFSSISKPVSKRSHTSAFMTDPPPLPPQSSPSHTSPPPLPPESSSSHTDPPPLPTEFSPSPTDPAPLLPESSTSHRDPPPLPPQSSTSHTDPPPLPSQSSSSHRDPPPLPQQSSTSHLDPPPLPPESSPSDTKPSSKGPTQLSAHDTADINKSTKVGLEENAKELSSSLFSSTSDEDIFSSITSHKKSAKTPVPEASKEKTEVLISGEDPELDAKTAAVVNSESTSQSEIEGSGEIFHSPADNVFKSISHPPNNESKQGAIIDQSDGTSEGLPKSFPKKDVNIGDNNKDDNIFDSTEDLFGITERLQKPDDFSKKNKDTHEPLKPDVLPQENSGTSGIVSMDAVNSVTSRSLKEDISDTLSERTLPPSPSSSQSKPSHAGIQEPKQNVTKPPVGGIALFGGKELAAQINKRKTLLEPAGEKEDKVENNIFDDVRDFVSEGKDQSKSNMFDDSDDDIFGNTAANSKKSTGSLPYRQSPPLLPEETEKIFSKKQEPEKVQIVESKPTSLDAEPKESHDIESDKQKLDVGKSEGESKEETASKEIKPKKKPPIGGVSMFGVGGMGGSELFAKVRQRKSMLAPESDSSEEDTPTEPTGTSKPITPSEEKGTTVTKPVMPVSPVSLLPPLLPVSAPRLRETKSGGDEKSVNFEDPATHSNVLQSLNKTRARGSIKRRPPSRAHRKGAPDRSDPSDTQDASPTASAMASSPEPPHIIATDISKKEPVQPGERLQHPSPDKSQRKVPKDVEQNEVVSTSTDMQIETSSKSSNCTEDIVQPAGTSHKKNKEKPVAENTDVLNASNSALGMSKSSSKQSSSLFGGSDSDEDLFGEVKQKKDVKKPSVSSGTTSVPKKINKKSKSHSLFDDEDDDASIFSSKSQAKKATASASRSVSVTKPKGNLKQSSEPFEDPLLGSLTK